MGGSDELPRYIDKRSNAVVVDDGTLDVNDLRLPTSEEMHTGFVVPEELIKMKLNETQVTSLYDDEPRFIPLIPPYITAQLEKVTQAEVSLDLRTIHFIMKKWLNKKESLSPTTESFFL